MRHRIRPLAHVPVEMAVGAAAVGCLVLGALLQEGIDVAVILNALRAGRGGVTA